MIRNIEALDNQIKYCEETNEDDHTKEVVDELDFLCIHNHLLFILLCFAKITAACYRSVTQALRVRNMMKISLRVKLCNTNVTSMLLRFNENVISL